VSRSSNIEIRQVLLRYTEQLDPRQLFVTLVPEAADLIVTEPYAFALASSLARRQDNEIAWTIPYDIYQELGHLDPRLVRQIPLRSLQALFLRLPRQPYLITGAPLTVTDLTDEVTGPCNGDASRLWRNRTAVEVRERFAKIYGAHDRDAEALILRLEFIYGVRFPDRAESRVLVHPSVWRVLSRLGLASNEDPAAGSQAIAQLHNGYPAEIDVPLWNIGRQWCRIWKPLCVDCLLAGYCPRIGV
jgi:endonuclease III